MITIKQNAEGTYVEDDGIRVSRIYETMYPTNESEETIENAELLIGRYGTHIDLFHVQKEKVIFKSRGNEFPRIRKFSKYLYQISYISRVPFKKRENKVVNIVINNEGKKLFVSGINSNVNYKMSEGLARVIAGEKWIFIDEEGFVIFDDNYEFAEDFKNGYAIVKRQGDMRNNRYLIDHEGNCPFNRIVYDFERYEGDYMVVTERKSECKNLLTVNLNPIFKEGQYKFIAVPNEHIIIVSNTEHDTTGIVDFCGNVLIPTIYTSVYPIMDGKYFYIYKGDKAGIVDEYGKIVVPVKYDRHIEAKDKGFWVKECKDGVEKFIHI